MNATLAYVLRCGGWMRGWFRGSAQTLAPSGQRAHPRQPAHFSGLNQRLADAPAAPCMGHACAKPAR